MNYATDPTRVLDHVIALNEAVINCRSAVTERAAAAFRIAYAMVVVELPPLQLQGVPTDAIQELMAEGVRLLHQAEATEDS